MDIILMALKLMLTFQMFVVLCWAVILFTSDLLFFLAVFPFWFWGDVSIKPQLNMH